MTDWNEVFERRERPSTTTGDRPMAKLEDIARMGDCTPPAVKGCDGPIVCVMRSGFRTIWERSTAPWWVQTDSTRIGG